MAGKQRERRETDGSIERGKRFWTVSMVSEEQRDFIDICNALLCHKYSFPLFSGLPGSVNFRFPPIYRVRQRKFRPLNNRCTYFSGWFE